MLIWLTPEVWDAYAISMTDFALYLLHPDGDPQTVVDDLWCRMGATASCMFDFAGVLDPVSWSTALASPGDMGQSLLGEILLPFFMLTPALAVSLATFIISEVRILFVTLVLVTLPLWVLLLHVPFVRPHARQMIDSMIGASMAPFLSAITLHAGWAYLANNPLPSLEDRISALGTIALAGSWPVALAPALGRISGKVDGAVSSAIVSSSMMAMQMGMGLAAGGLQGAQQAAGAGLRGGALARSALLGAGTGGGFAALGRIPEVGALRNTAESVAGTGGIVGRVMGATTSTAAGATATTVGATTDGAAAGGAAAGAGEPALAAGGGAAAASGGPKEAAT